MAEIREQARPRFKRKQYIVRKKFQVKYVGIILLFIFMTAALCSYVVYYTSMIMLGEKLANVYPQGRLVSIVKTVNFRILLSIILVSPLVAVIGIFLSHRIAGPIYRMEKFLFDMAQGNLSNRIVLRKGDELLTLADGINNLSESMKTTVLAQKARLNKIRSEAENLRKAGANTGELSKEVDELNKELDKFKV